MLNKPHQSTINNRLTLLAPALLALLLLMACCTPQAPARQVARSFYFWKSVFMLTAYEQQALAALQVKRLYVKFFDVTWDASSGQPLPVAVIKFPLPGLAQCFTIIPAVFITNECLQRMDTLQAAAAAVNITSLIDTIAARAHIARIPEIQIDCDWNAATRDRYFRLLSAVRRLAAGNHRKLSATIRLYQCKYAGKTGIPPVDRGLLMCYNMGNLRNPSVHNSILETEELKKYISALPQYPLPLDVALPLFNWKVLFRKNTYAGLIREMPASVLANHPYVKQAGNRFTFLRNTSLNGYDFLAGDFLRDEQVNADDVIAAATLLNRKLDTRYLSAALYHLDSLTLSKFSIHELETIFDHLH